MRFGVRVLMYCLTAGGWLVTVAHALLGRWLHVPMGLALLSAAVGVAGAVVSVMLWVQRPVEAIWQAGREYGRREAMRESSPAPLIYLDEVRAEHRGASLGS